MEDKLSQVIKHDRQGDEPQETFDIVNASQEQGLREYRLGRADELRQKRQVKHRGLGIEHIGEKAFQEALLQRVQVATGAAAPHLAER